MDKKGQGVLNLLILILIVLVIISIAVILFYSSKNKNEPEAIPEIQENVQNNQETINAEQSTKFINDCSNEETVNQRDWCFLDIAKQYYIDACENIVQDNFKYYCRAVINSDAASCESILQGNFKDACYISVAQITGNKNICSKTTKEDYCISLIPN